MNSGRHWLMECVIEATLDNVLDRPLFWLNWYALEYETACFAWNET